MIYIVLGLIGAVAGSFYFYGRGDFLLGGAIGLLAAAAIDQRNRLLALEKRLEVIETQRPEQTSDADIAQPAATTDASDASVPPDTSAKAPIAGPPPDAAAGVGTTDDIPSLEIELADAAPDDIRPPEKPPIARPPEPPSPGLGDSIRKFLFGGNLMVRVGVVVLLFGFAFLVKYAAARDMVPLEIRLAAAFVAGIGLLILGWRLRGSRFGYAVALQGGGIGVMYLTLFAAARLFHMVPLALTFGVMVGLVVFSGMLAVLQNAASMAVLGAAGGFMAPVLLSTGTGSHVMLFAYYAILNAGICGIAWFRAWRWLNLLGFVFTFGIGAAWGLEYYRPRYFATTEPFLVLFFLFYLFIAVLFALRQPPRLKGYVDGTLVFGMPLVVFSLQVGLVRNMAFGLALSAVAMGLVYTGLATALWRRRHAEIGPLVEAFLALGVIFGSLAIPLALSGSWTAVAWSLEGAGLVWVGVRQRRWTARGFGLLLQIGSGVLFFTGAGSGGGDAAVIDSRQLGGILLGLCGLFSAWLLERRQDRLHRIEKPLAAVMLAWGLLWWFGTGLDEIDRRLSRRHELSAALAFIGVSALAMGFLYRRIGWKMLRWPALGLLPIMGATAAALTGRYDFRHPFQNWWLIVWPVLFAVHLFVLRCMEADWKEKIARAWHVAGVLLALVLISGEAGWLLDRLAAGASVWAFLAWGVVPAAAAVALMRLRGRMAWPFGSWATAYHGWLPFLLVVWLLGWTVAAAAQNGDPRPLPYLPLLNPLDIVQAIALLVAFYWVLDTRRSPMVPAAALQPTVLWGAVAAGGFLWLTASVARCVHHFGAIAYRSHALFHSDLFHAAISVLWGLLALGCMVAASRLKQRPIWFAGAGLLAVVVVKLFIVDLSGSGTVSRIVSFLAVGGLMLVVGYFTPLPPLQSEGEES